MVIELKWIFHNFRFVCDDFNDRIFDPESLISPTLDAVVGTALKVTIALKYSIQCATLLCTFYEMELGSWILDYKLATTCQLTESTLLIFPFAMSFPPTPSQTLCSNLFFSWMSDHYLIPYLFLIFFQLFSLRPLFRFYPLSFSLLILHSSLSHFAFLLSIYLPLFPFLLAVRRVLRVLKSSADS